MKIQKEWFSEWFDSPYYHILYRNRDEKEAEYFLSRLVNHLQLPATATITDLACGKGRHSIYLNSLGFDVTGVDLSAHSIAIASQSSNEKLHFRVDDLRRLEIGQTFDVAMNLFTSFAYFQSMDEDITVLRNIHQILKPGGTLVIDFMNAEWVMQNLVEHESKTIEGIYFNISKRIEKGFIYKKIHFADENRDFEFTEKVQALTLENFMELFAASGFTLKEKFGDYTLSPFKVATSPRLIMILEKNA